MGQRAVAAEARRAVAALNRVSGDVKVVGEKGRLCCRRVADTPRSPARQGRGKPNGVVADAEPVAVSVVGRPVRRVASALQRVAVAA